MKLTAPLASINGIPGARRDDAWHASADSSGSRGSRGIGAPGVRAFPRRYVLTVTTVLLVVLLGTVCGSALATTGHSFGGPFGGPFSSPQVGVGLSGEVFVATGGNEVQRFDAAGNLQSAFSSEPPSPAVAVDSAPAGGVYLSSSPNTGVSFVNKYSAAGSFEYTLDASLSETNINEGPVAVDPANGTVYTTATNVNTGAQLIDSFSQTTGVYIASFDGSSGSPDGGFICPSGLAVDPTHHVYVLDRCKGAVGRIDRYSASGTWEATVDDGSRGTPEAVAADPKTGEVYVAETARSGLQITNFSVEGASVVNSFPAANIEAAPFVPLSLAVGPDGTVYLTDPVNSLVDRFTAFAGPTVTTAAASETTTTGATLNGTINAEGIASEYHYEYGLDTTYGSSTASIDAGSGSGANEAPGPVTGLVPNTTYHYRIVGTNASGRIVGADETLTTVAAPPHVDGSPAFVTTITPTGARVHATVNPEHSFTSFRIEYGTSTAYGSVAPEGGAEVGEQSSDQAVATNLTGLEPGTEYHYRVSAENGVEGPQTGADGTFFTAPAAPAAASELTTKKATLAGTIDPHGAATSYHFNYGPGTSYGSSTPEVEAGSGNAEQTVSEHISGLAPGTTYHVQVVATTNGISSSGADGTFTTPPAPGATASDPVAVTTSSATLQGAADTHGQTGSYHFEVTATEGSFTTSTAGQALPAGSGARPVGAAVTGLPSGQGLRVRLVVTSNEATQISEPVAFATATPPPEGFPAPPSPGSLYGCAAPKLNPINGKIKPGQTITVSGSDLGLAGSVLLGEYTLNATGWSATGFTIEVPADATGTLGLTVNCGTASNTVAVATTGVPVNSFTITKKAAKGITATFTVELPGPGALQSSGAGTKSTTAKVTAAGAQMVKVTLNKAGAKALRKARKRKLTVKVQLRFTPIGGSAATQTASVTFTRKGGK